MLRNKKVLLSILSIMAILMFAFASSPFKFDDGDHDGDDPSPTPVVSGGEHESAKHEKNETRVCGQFDSDGDKDSARCHNPEAENDNDLDDMPAKFGSDLADFVALSKAPAGTAVQNTTLTSAEDTLPVYTVTLVNGGYTWTVTINSQNGNIIQGGYRTLSQSVDYRKTDESFSGHPPN